MTVLADREIALAPAATSYSSAASAVSSARPVRATGRSQSLSLNLGTSSTQAHYSRASSEIRLNFQCPSEIVVRQQPVSCSRNSPALATTIVSHAPTREDRASHRREQRRREGNRARTRAAWLRCRCELQFRPAGAEATAAEIDAMGANRLRGGRPTSESPRRGPYVLRRCSSRFQRLNILVNNAGRPDLETAARLEETNGTASSTPT